MPKFLNLPKPKGLNVFLGKNVVLKELLIIIKTMIMLLLIIFIIIIFIISVLISLSLFSFGIFAVHVLVI